MATIISALPYTLTNGTTADASQVQSNFSQIVANVNANGAAAGANSDITSLTGLTTPLGRTYGGSQFFVGGTSTGAADAQVVATLTPTGFSLYTGVMIAFIAGFNNTGATTFEIGGAAVKNVFRQISSGAAACVGGEIKSGQLVVAVYDGTQWQLVNSGYLSTALLRSLGGLSVVAGNIIYGSGADTAAVLAPGTSGQFLTSGGAGAPTWTTPTAFATQAEMEAASSTTVIVSPGRMQYNPGVAKAWVNFTSGASPALNASHNVSGVVRNGIGDYTVSFTTAFSSANYACMGVVYDTVIRSLLVQPYNQATGNASVFIFNTSTGAASSTFGNCQMTFYGDQ